jgi:hypothetical protein
MCRRDLGPGSLAVVKLLVVSILLVDGIYGTAAKPTKE